MGTPGTAGYPDEAGPPILVVREGRTVASIRVLRAGDGLVFAGTGHCPDVNIRW